MVNFEAFLALYAPIFPCEGRFLIRKRYKTNSLTLPEVVMQLRKCITDVCQIKLRIIAENGPKWPIYAGFGHFWDIKVTISRKWLDKIFLNFATPSAR